ncbi:MAG: cupin domain-containing protein [Bryobacteraceae bacterium]
MKDARYWIDRLELEPHPEGGYYRQTYRSTVELPGSALPRSFGGNRSASTAIYFLLQGTDFSAFHRIASDEIWHFYAGGPLSVHIIDCDGQHSEIKLGPSPEEGETFQGVVAAGCWFSSCLAQPDTFALVGCTVAPGFDFNDFEMADRSSLLGAYPKQEALIRRLTRPQAEPV